MKFKQRFKEGQKVLINGKEYTVHLKRTEWPKGSPQFSTSNETWELGEDKYLTRKEV